LQFLSCSKIFFAFLHFHILTLIIFPHSYIPTFFHFYILQVVRVSICNSILLLCSALCWFAFFRMALLYAEISCPCRAFNLCFFTFLYFQILTLIIFPHSYISTFFHFYILKVVRVGDCNSIFRLFCTLHPAVYGFINI
jgi:hypothetical protein